MVPKVFEVYRTPSGFPSRIWSMRSSWWKLVYQNSVTAICRTRLPPPGGVGDTTSCFDQVWPHCRHGLRHQAAHVVARQHGVGDAEFFRFMVRRQGSPDVRSHHLPDRRGGHRQADPRTREPTSKHVLSRFIPPQGGALLRGTHIGLSPVRVRSAHCMTAVVAVRTQSTSFSGAFTAAAGGRTACHSVTIARPQQAGSDRAE